MNRSPWVLLLALAGLGCSSDRNLPQAEESPPPGTTRLPPLGARQVRAFRCDLEVSTGRVKVEPVSRLTKDEEDAWKNPSRELFEGNRSFKVESEDNRVGHAWMPDWVRVTVNEFGERGRPVRTLPVRIFQGAHDGRAIRGLRMDGERLRFFMEFWVDD
ncbi:MAG TPA: hypothetical protein VEN81_02175 [Planctomycetota bacterium]|nr:hypothetical protein [Planctomycetota bacterium]